MYISYGTGTILGTLLHDDPKFQHGDFALTLETDKNKAQRALLVEVQTLESFRFHEKDYIYIVAEVLPEKNKDGTIKLIQAKRPCMSVSEKDMLAIDVKFNKSTETMDPTFMCGYDITQKIVNEENITDILSIKDTSNKKTTQDLKESTYDDSNITSVVKDMDLQPEPKQCKAQITNSTLLDDIFSQFVQNPKEPDLKFHSTYLENSSVGFSKAVMDSIDINPATDFIKSTTNELNFKITAQDLDVQDSPFAALIKDTKDKICDGPAHPYDQIDKEIYAEAMTKSCIRFLFELNNLLTKSKEPTKSNIQKDSFYIECKKIAGSQKEALKKMNKFLNQKKNLKGIHPLEDYFKSFTAKSVALIKKAALTGKISPLSIYD